MLSLAPVCWLNRSGHVLPRRSPHVDVELELSANGRSVMLLRDLDLNAVVAGFSDGETHSLEEASEVVEQVRVGESYPQRRKEDLRSRSGSDPHRHILSDESSAGNPSCEVTRRDRTALACRRVRFA